MNDTAQFTSGQPNQSQQTQDSYVDSYVPPVSMTSDGSAAPSAPMAAVESAAAATNVAQSLEDQNIFHLLGVEDGSDEEKEAFLDELQQVIWEDFLENDVELLLTEEEMAELATIRAKQGQPELEQQEEIIVYLEKLIPDLEAILLEKALELKEDMVRERISGMKEYYAQDQQSLTKLVEAETLINDDQWRSAAELLNTL